MKKICHLMVFILFIPNGLALAEEQFMFTLGTLPTWNNDLAQMTFISGYMFGLQAGCSQGAVMVGGDFDSAADMCVDKLTCKPSKIRELLLEIAEKDKYKKIHVALALGLIINGCSNDEFDYAQIYSSLDGAPLNGATESK